MHKDAEVPCGGCRACCQGGENVILYPERDDLGSYLTEVKVYPRTGRPSIVLRHAANGDCVYLGPDGCTIRDRRPYACRVFDCRKLAALFGDDLDQMVAVSRGQLSLPVYNAARSR